MKHIVVAISGASGTVYGIKAVKALVELGYRVSLIISDAARLVIKEEQGVALKSLVQKKELENVFGNEIHQSVEVYSVKDFTAPIASGSYPIDAMVVIPCSMGTVGAIAHGLSQNLIHRAADCVIKEGRRLVLVPRETPLSAIHLDNLSKLAKIGVRIVPAMPGFYSRVESLEDLVDFMVGKVFDQLNVPHTLYPRWTGPIEKKDSLTF